MFEALEIPSPKRKSKLQGGWEDFFQYYAGYPEAFARTVLTSAQLSANTVVLDPWNGSGTTTYAASLLGLRSIGVDLNPVMVIVARARLLPPSEADSVKPIGTEIVRSASRARIKLDGNDPLLVWFERKTAKALRAIEREIERILLGPGTLTPNSAQLDRMSGLAGTAYVALFAVCRELVHGFRSSNPTWLRLPRDGESKVQVEAKIVNANFERTLGGMADALATRSNLVPTEQGATELRLADTTKTIFVPNSADLILTSPPYCTRIDYTAATRVELAVVAPLINCNPENLSRQMLGSTRVPTTCLEVSPNWGERCAAFLSAMRAHRSRASSGYYYKTHIDYFSKLSRSLQQIGATLREGGVAIFVVRDSYYKDLHNDLPAVVADMAKVNGLQLKRRDDFRLPRTLGDINPGTRAYRRPSGAVEAVLCFRKG